jgi:hypothetical protein
MNQTKVEWNLSADAQAQYSFVQLKQPSTAFKNIVCSTLPLVQDASKDQV